jgi:hypothetical protein
MGAAIMIQRRHALGGATLISDRLQATQRLSAVGEALQGSPNVGEDAALLELDPEIGRHRMIEALDRVVDIDRRLIESGYVELIDEMVDMAGTSPLPAPSIEPRQRLRALRQRLRGLGMVLALVPIGNLAALRRLRAEIDTTFSDIRLATRQRDRLLGRR